MLGYYAWEWKLTMAHSYSQNHHTMPWDNLSMAANPYWQQHLLTYDFTYNYWVLRSAVIKTSVYFAHLSETQCHFNKFNNINMTNAMYIFIKLLTSLITLREATGLYTTIWQALHTVRHSLFLLYILDNTKLLNTLVAIWCNY